MTSQNESMQEGSSKLDKEKVFKNRKASVHIGRRVPCMFFWFPKTLNLKKKLRGHLSAVAVNKGEFIHFL